MGSCLGIQVALLVTWPFARLIEKASLSLTPLVYSKLFDWRPRRNLCDSCFIRMKLLIFLLYLVLKLKLNKARTSFYISSRQSSSSEGKSTQMIFMSLCTALFFLYLQVTVSYWCPTDYFLPCPFYHKWVVQKVIVKAVQTQPPNISKRCRKLVCYVL